jgi:magnesium transporter
VLVNCAVYESGHRRDGDLSLGQAAGAARGEDAFVWLGLFEPTAEEFASIADEFDLHELAVEDAVKAHQRPKIELYGDTLLVVVKTAHYVDPEEVIQVGELLLFVNLAFNITVRHGEGELGAASTQRRGHPRQRRSSPRCSRDQIHRQHAGRAKRA